MFVCQNDVGAVTQLGSGERPRLSLCMIVRDNENTLEPCLASIRPWVDEMVVVDTGSKDKTLEIAKSFGARIFHFPWCDDFSAARNESLRHARGEWLFWMDSDDTIDEENGRKLRQLAYGQHEPGTLGYVMQVHCPDGGNGTSELTVVDHVKMFRNHPDLRFEGRIHEQVLMPIRRLGGEVEWTDIFVVHSHADQTADGRRKKYERDLRILGLDLEDRPAHPFVLFNLGMTYSDMGEHDEAVKYLQQCLQVSDPGESHVRKVYALLVNSLRGLGRKDDARKACERGRQIYPDDPELLFREGMLHHESGRYWEAVASYRAALRNGDNRHFSSIDRGIVGFKARHNLAVTYRDMGELGLAEVEWRHVLDEVPTYRPAWKALGDVLIAQGKLATAEVEIGRMQQHEALVCDALLLMADLMVGRGDLTGARGCAEEAVRRFPDAMDPVQCLCRLLFEHGDPSEAEKALSKLIERDPEDGAAHHNLGLVYLRLGQPTLAAESFRSSLHVRPGSVNTWEQLAVALDELGLADEAGSAQHRANVLKVTGPSTDGEMDAE